jgi:hypothetical protein
VSAAAGTLPASRPRAVLSKRPDPPPGGRAALPTGDGSHRLLLVGRTPSVGGRGHEMERPRLLRPPCGPLRGGLAARERGHPATVAAVLAGLIARVTDGTLTVRA